MRGQPLTLAASFTDLGPFAHTLNWRVQDSGGGAVAGSSQGTTFGFTPTSAGNYTAVFTVTDDVGGAATRSQVFTVKVVDVQPDPRDGTHVILAVGGSLGNDDITISPGGSNGQLAVTLNGSSLGSFAAPGGTSFSRVSVFAQAGDDDIQVAGGITLPAWLYGGDGDDRLKGGGGDDVLLGGPATTCSSAATAATCSSAASGPTASWATPTTTSSSRVGPPSTPTKRR